MARRKPQPPEKRRPQKKKVSILSSESITYIDYKDVNLLRRFMSERAKIRARRVTGNSAQQQREVARAIRVAREMALLPYAVRQVTTRRGGRRDRDRDRDRDREPRSDAAPAAPSSPPPPPAESVGTDAGAERVDEAGADGLEPKATTASDAATATPETGAAEPESAEEPAE